MTPTKEELPLHLQHNSLTLRTATAADVPHLTRWWNDGAVMAHAGFPNGLGTTEEEVRAGLNERSLMLEENGVPIGEANYRPAGEGVAEIGIKICVASCQNRGVGRIFLSLLIRHLFSGGYNKIILDTNLNNLRAQHVYESLGFTKVRVNIDAWKDQMGAWQSSVDYELTEPDFIDFSLR